MFPVSIVLRKKKRKTITNTLNGMICTSFRFFIDTTKTKNKR